MANYSKTSKGVIEIEERKYHLSARLRRLLILIDGSKNNQKVNMMDNMCVGGDGMIYITHLYEGLYRPNTDGTVTLASQLRPEGSLYTLEADYDFVAGVAERV